MTTSSASDASPKVPTAADVAAVRSEPRFVMAVAAIAASGVDYYQGRWLANRVLNDRARFVMASFMLYLHFSHRDDVANSGLTAARLREICVGEGLCSAGRVEAMLAMMRASGYLERAPAGDRRVRRYVPTEKLIELHRVRHGRVMAALDILRGDTDYARRICGPGADQAYGQFIQAMGLGFLAGYRLIDPAPELQKTVDRDVGLPILLCVLLASPNYAALAPERIGPVSVAALARRFDVSRIHVRSVLREAEATGLIERDVDLVRIAALPALINAVEKLFAGAFVFTESCAEIALHQSAQCRP